MPLFAACMGFTVGGSFVWGIDHPNEKQRIGTPETITASSRDQVPESKTTDERLANYTLWLAILTGCLVAVSAIQGGFLYRADKTARLTAEAAKQSASVSERAFEHTYSPYIDVSVKTAAGVHRMIGGGVVLQFMSINRFADYTIHNYGNSPAIVLEIYPACLISQTIPAEIPFPPPQTNLRQIISVGGMKASDPLPLGYPPGWRDGLGGFPSWVMLQVRYRDVFRDQYISNFCFSFSSESGTFTAQGGPKYNNRRKLTDAELEIAEARDK
jgi:hypothetical protein